MELRNPDGNIYPRLLAVTGKSMSIVQKRICVFGNFGIGNFGNDASLKSMLLFLERTQPNAKVTCVCPVPEKVRRDHNIDVLPIGCASRAPWRKIANLIYAIRSMRRFDVMVLPGTGILNDYGSSPFGLPFQVFRWCLAARLCGVKIALVSVGAGPVCHPLTGWFIKKIALFARYRSYRNKFSKEFLNGLGVDTTKDSVYPDIAFKLPVPTASPRPADEMGRLTVGVGAMLYHGWRGHKRTDDSIYEQHLADIQRFVIWLLDRGYRVRLLMGDESDVKAINEVSEAVREKRPALANDVLLAEPSHSFADVMQHIADVDVVIAARFHNLVFSAMLGKPTVSMGYANYHREFMKQIGLGRFNQDTEKVNVEVLIEQFNEVMSNREHYEALILGKAVAFREALAQQEAILDMQFFKTMV